MPNRVGPLRHGNMAVSLSGLAELQRALKRSDSNARRYLLKELRDIAKDVAVTARAGVSHKTGRHGGANVPRLEDTIKTSVAGAGASVYSDAPHAIVQDSGGRVGHSAIITRASASHYMTEAVDNARPYVVQRMETLLDELGRDFEES